MKILADENITQVIEHFSPYGEVSTVAGRAITNAMLQDVDVLLVRSITPVTPALLKNSPCRFVGTATSGLDHLDVPGLQAAGITLGWAAGCNSMSVVDYVFSALARLFSRASGECAGADWRTCSVGIVGCGQIGSALAQSLQRLGMSFSVYDPFLTDAHPYGHHLATLDDVLRQDIITLHVPLTLAGPWPTFHLLDEKALTRIPPHSVLINAARGAVIDNAALLAWLQTRKRQAVVLDTWENEPRVNLQLLQEVQIGTPHIAGYSYEGKLKGTTMLVEQLCRHFGYQPPPPQTTAKDTPIVTAVHGSSTDQLNQLLLAAYDVGKDHADMQALLNSISPAQDFDNLRKRYPVRHEFAHFCVTGEGLLPELQAPLQALGFQLSE